MVATTELVMLLVSVMSAELVDATSVDTALIQGLPRMENYSLDDVAEGAQSKKASCSCTFTFDNSIAKAYMNGVEIINSAWPSHPTLTFECGDVSTLAFEGYDWQATGCSTGYFYIICSGGAPWGGLRADETWKVYSLSSSDGPSPVVYDVHPTNWYMPTFDDSTWANAQRSSQNPAGICDSGGHYWLFRKTFPSLLPAPTPAPPAPTPAPPAPTSTAPLSAIGDPHLQNMYGQRFDLMKQGKFTLINIPRGQPAQDSLLVVDAEARALGGQCADMYFTQVNITGAWAEKAQTGGFRFDADGPRDERAKWEKCGPVELKVANGRTDKGARYLNFYVRHLGSAGLDVGGLLGADDHTDAATPTETCHKSLSLWMPSQAADVVEDDRRGASVASVAEAESA